MAKHVAIKRLLADLKEVRSCGPLGAWRFGDLGLAA
jgi:hypothetical protein